MKLSSMTKWYPALESFEEVKTPKTRKVEIDTDNRAKCPTEKIQNSMLQLGNPVFMRTDAASNKHSMKKASKIQERDKDLIKERYRNLIEFNMEMMLPFQTLYLREWLDLKHRFTAFGGTPIAEELRFFIHNGEIINYHFYWPENSIKFRGESPEDWELKWLKTKRDALDNSIGAVKQARVVAERFRGQGFWSVDFARTNEGDWVCIDMAKGEVSWMPGKEKPTVKVGEYEKLHDRTKNGVGSRLKAVEERIREVEQK